MYYIISLAAECRCDVTVVAGGRPLRRRPAGDRSRTDVRLLHASAWGHLRLARVDAGARQRVLICNIILSIDVVVILDHL